MPRGGVPVAAEVARALGIPLDVVIVRKLGVPTHRELAMGAIGEDGVRFIDQELVAELGITTEQIATIERAERAELERRATTYRQGAPRLALDGKTVLLVDDGIATGATARVACRAVRAHGASRIVLAVPIAPTGWEELMTDEADAFVTVSEQGFSAVGELYDDFSAVSDEEVVRCLSQSRRGAAAPRVEYR